MRCLFYIHGTPKGQNVWGAEEDRDYIKSCYTGEAEEKIRFMIEISPRKNRTYFTYLRCKNFLSVDNRPGAYFGMTLSLDGLYYCKDTANLYKLFDQIYTNYIANGTIVEKRQDKEAYLVSSFAEKAPKLEEVQKILMQTLNDSFIKTGDICPIENNISKEPSAPHKYNLSDVDSQAFYASLFKNLKVYVSTDYPSKDNLIAHLNQQINPEKEKNKRMAEECSKLQEQLSNTIRERDSLRQKAGVLDTAKQQLEGTLRDKEQRISDLEQRNRLLEKERTKQQVETTIRQIHPQIKELSKQMSLIAPDRQYDVEYERKEKCTPQSVCSWVTLGVSVLCLLILAFIMVFLLCPHLFTCKQGTTPSRAETHRVITSTPVPPATPQGITVDFKNNRGDCIYQDSAYAVCAKNVPTGNKTEWKMDGFDIVSGEKISQQVYVRVNKGVDKAILSLYVEGKKEWSQEYKVQK